MCMCTCCGGASCMDVLACPTVSVAYTPQVQLVVDALSLHLAACEPWAIASTGSCLPSMLRPPCLAPQQQHIPLLKFWKLHDLHAKKIPPRQTCMHMCTPVAAHAEESRGGGLRAAVAAAQGRAARAAQRVPRKEARRPHCEPGVGVVAVGAVSERAWRALRTWMDLASGDRGGVLLVFLSF